jgi:hypothetical protein
MSLNPFLTEKVVKATWDIPNHPSFEAAVIGGTLATGSYSPNDGIVTIPSGAIITDVIVDVETDCATSKDDTGTAALGYTGATGAFVAAIAVSDASNVWDAGVQGSLLKSFALDGDALTAIAMKNAIADTYIKAGANVNLLLTLATEGFTAGKISVYVKYIN